MKKNKTEVIRVTKEELSILEEIRQLALSSKDPKTVKRIVSHNEGSLWFILPDPHYPYQNEPLMQKVYKCISDNDVAGVVSSGDWLDLFTLGSYNRDSLGLLKGISLTEEYESGKEGIVSLSQAAGGKAKKVFIWGNHEDRFFRELNTRDNAKYGDELMHPDKALELDKYGFDSLQNWKDDFYTVGDLDIMHGMYCNIHTAKKHLDMHGRSVMFGHTHRVQTHFTAHEAAFNIGCLADIPNRAFGYMPRMQRENWSNGLAAIRVVDGRSYVEMITVRNGKFIFNGKVY
tara:strand:- start:1169 stop:2032 length:864 start_codon:yes stop_codon:yes gene_type:complete